MKKKTLLEEILLLTEAKNDEDWTDYEDDDDYDDDEKKESYLRKLIKYGLLGGAAIGVPALAYLGYKKFGIPRFSNNDNIPTSPPTEKQNLRKQQKDENYNKNEEIKKDTISKIIPEKEKKYTGYSDIEYAMKNLNKIINDYKSELYDKKYLSHEEQNEILNNIISDYKKEIERYPIIYVWLEKLLQSKEDPNYFSNLYNLKHFRGKTY